MKQCSLCLCGMICTCGKQDENAVLTPGMLRGKNPMGEKFLSNFGFLLCIYMVIGFDMKHSVHLCMGIKSKACLMHEFMYSECPICIQKIMHG